jgi:hypothetical protein
MNSSALDVRLFRGALPAPYATHGSQPRCLWLQMEFQTLPRDAEQ